MVYNLAYKARFWVSRLFGEIFTPRTRLLSVINAHLAFDQVG